MEEGTDDVRVAAQAADGGADAFLQHRQIGRAQPAERVLFQPGPQPFIRVHLRGVGREAKHVEARAVSRQGLASSTGAMGIATIPQQEQGRGNPTQQMADKANHLVTGDGSGNQMQVGMRIRCDGGYRRQLGPVETVAQNRRLSTRRPGAAGGGEQ